MFKFISSKTFAVVLTLVVASVSHLPAFAQKEVVTLKSGTPVVLTTTTSLTSKNVIAGSTVDFKVVSDVIADGKVVIPAGTIAKGQVSHANKASALGKGGDLSIAVNAVNASDGTLVPLSGGQISDNGDSKLGLAIVCGLCTLFGFLIHGSQAEIPAGAQVQAVVMSNTSVAL